MEVHDGFITRIHSYCDRWCETCAFTSWCEVFAEDARLQASRDPALLPVVEAPLLPQDLPPEQPSWVAEMIEEAISDAMESPAPAPRSDLERRDHPLLQRARDYFVNVHTWLDDRHGAKTFANPSDPLAVISWFSPLIPAKIGRALSGLAWAESDDFDDVRDYDGSAKVALIGIERSHAAWLDVGDGAGPFIADLVWMGEALEEMFPRARAFVRPAFDEPDAVARLLAETP
jgi:hypothetical protein